MPLRAVITATFTDNSDDQTRVAMAQDQSPDLTHVRMVKAGDNLPALCGEIYNDPALLSVKWPAPTGSTISAT